MKTRGILKSAICILLVLQSCNPAKKSVSGKPGTETPGSANAQPTIPDLADSGNRFAADLFRQIREENANMVFSPYSISSVLGMVYSGAAGQTADQMAEVLYLPPPGESEEAAMQLHTQILSNDTVKGTQLNLANAIWAQEDFSFLEDYTARIRKYRQAPLNQVDFIDAEAREDGRMQINRWVEDNTGGRIRDLISPGVLSANTRMVLTNAIYFNGKWQWPFDKHSTSPSRYNISAGETIMTPFMNQTHSFPYYQDEGVRAVMLPYNGERLSMMIILPEEQDGWKKLSRELDFQKLKNMASNMTSREVFVSLPKFTLEMKLNLKKELSEMGMPEAFSKEADFSGMTGKKNLFVDEVIHKAFIEVSESGTEAAAATAAIMSLKAALRDEPMRFNADHPFLYLIRDHESGAIIFMGRMVRPGTGSD